MATKTQGKSTVKTAKRSPPTEKRGSRQPDSPDSPDSHVNDIATAAYFKAEQRGFAPGRELDDWLEAEAEILTRH